MYTEMISIIILTKNEEKNILDCLETVSWADEIIILDDNSIDRTVEIAKTQNLSNLKILEQELAGDFSKQRNYALSHATNEWVLFIDADERVTPELRREINDFIIEEKEKPVFKGMFIKRRDILWGRLLKHGETGHVKFLRLARKNAGTWYGKVHEKWLVDGETDSFENYLIHYPHQTISEFLQEINFYTSLRAKELLEKGEKASIVKIIAYPKAKFIQNYFFRLGFLDGLEGLVQTILMSFHSFLVRAKLWTYLDKKQTKS
jgi:glycosyltransferase involved in cell wall biosynthesis